MSRRPERPASAADLWAEVQSLEREARHSHQVAMSLGGIGMVGGLTLLVFFFCAENKLAQNMNVGFAIACLSVLSQVSAWLLMLVASRKTKRVAQLRAARRQLAREMTGK
jgi:hypothetical protein